MPMDKDAYLRMMGKAPVRVKEINTEISAAPSVPNLNCNGAAPDNNSQDFDGYTKKFIKHDWQIVDMFHLMQYCEPVIPGQREDTNIGTANWSEMGAIKTSTGLWHCEQRVGIKHNPAILIITSKGGKGTFFEMVPEILPDYTIVNIETQSLSIYKNGH